MKLFGRKSHPTVCPKCGGKVVPIVYGMPLPEMEEKEIFDKENPYWCNFFSASSTSSNGNR